MFDGRKATQSGNIKGKMKYKNVYKLSSRYSPPKISLRDAQILDCGNERHAKRAIHHKIPDDVTRDDFDYYGWIYSFMEFEDLLFYFYPLALEYEKDKTIDCIDSFMYSLDRILPSRKLLLNRKDMAGIHEGLRWILESGGYDSADWEQCQNLQKEIGISAE